MNGRRMIVLLSGVVLLVMCSASNQGVSAQTPAPQPAVPAATATAAAPAAAPAPAPAAAPAVTPQAADAHRYAEEVLKSIAGKENLPAGEVFQDIEIFKTVPAGRLPRIMEGFSKALGVSCEHCHVAGRWESDEKRPKNAARDMLGMVGTITQTLQGMKNLKNPDPQVTCTTCHRGQVTPATKL